MKRIIILNTLLLTLSIATISCSSSLNEDMEKVKTAFIKSRGLKPELFSFSEIKFLRDVTVEDSINYFLGDTDEIIKAHDETAKKLNEWVSLKEKEVGSYSQWDHDSYIQQFTNELNNFSDAFDGKFADDTWKYNYTYRNLYRLRQTNRDKVVGKIYSITYKLNNKTQTQIWLFDSEITTTVGGVLDDEKVKQPSKRDIEKIHFKRYEEIVENEDVPQAEFIHENGTIKEFDEDGNPIE